MKLKDLYLLIGGKKQNKTKIHGKVALNNKTMTSENKTNYEVTKNYSSNVQAGW